MKNIETKIELKEFITSRPNQQVVVLRKINHDSIVIVPIASSPRWPEIHSLTFFHLPTLAIPPSTLLTPREGFAQTTKLNGTIELRLNLHRREL